MLSKQWKFVCYRMLYLKSSETSWVYLYFHWSDFPEYSYFALPTHALQTVQVLLWSRVTKSTSHENNLNFRLYFGSHWWDFHENSYLVLSIRALRTVQACLPSLKNQEHFAWRANVLIRLYLGVHCKVFPEHPCHALSTHALQTVQDF